MTVDEILTSNQKRRDKAAQLRHEHGLSDNHIARLLSVTLNTACQWRNHHYQRTNRLLHGITEARYKQQLMQQLNKCEICEQDMADEACVDHSHATGQVRGLLCTSCNGGIGFFKDDILLLRRAVRYLNRYTNGQSR